MTTQNPSQNEPKPETTPVAAVAPKDEKSDKPSEVTLEMTDEEMEAIAGGGFGVENPTTVGSATGGAGAGKIKFN